MKATRLAILLIAAAGMPATVFAQAEMGTEEQRAAGKALYDKNCAQCHGAEGAGDGPAMDYFRPAPRNFQSGTFKFRSTASGELPSHKDIVNSIRDGMPYTGMPPWPNLSQSQLNNLAYYIKTFADDFSGPYGKPELVEFDKVPSFDASRLDRGREVYLENQCSDCHGELGRGDGKSALTLEDQWGFHIKPADLTRRWTFRGGSSRQDIYQTFTTGLDGSPMPSYEIEPPEDRWALVDYVYSLSRDEPEYGTTVITHPAEAAVSLSEGETMFGDHESVLFPVVGQVIEPGRAFYPGINGIQVRAVHDSMSVAVELKWNDMAREPGTNAPDMEVPLFEEDTTSAQFSDAVMIQIPAEPAPGIEKPYFMTGSSKNPVDLWHVDLGTEEATRYTATGSTTIVTNDDNPLEVSTSYQHGQWKVVFTYPLSADEADVFQEGVFVPVAFSIWDGFYQERGNKRGITSWYSLYIAPTETESPALKMFAYGILTLIVGVGLVLYARRKYKDADIA